MNAPLVYALTQAKIRGANTTTKLGVLLLLHEESLAVSELVSLLSSTYSVVTQTKEKLLRGGLIRQESSYAGGSRRRLMLTITPEGSAIAELFQAPAR